MATRIAGQSKAWPVLLLIFLILLLTASLSNAATGSNDLLEDEVDGLILRKTLTRTGNYFYDQFASRMADTGDLAGFNIVVSERVLPHTGGFIWVEVNDRVVFETLLARNRDFSGEVNRAVQAVNDFILQTYFENGGRLEKLGSAPEFY